jgi:antitoxin Phd
MFNLARRDRFHVEWKLQDAKARFSEFVARALAHGPQIVTRHGENVVAAVPYRQFMEATGSGDFKEFLLSAPLEKLDRPREIHLPREVELD